MPKKPRNAHNIPESHRWTVVQVHLDDDRTSVEWSYGRSETSARVKVASKGHAIAVFPGWIHPAFLNYPKG